ncbi:MAG: hypothetical protein FD146_2610 [Anaerolineaceae bacterium]|nr:MAG: hypothetical protein FD146_2610 [Anaerolineaceae bacterium]
MKQMDTRRSIQLAVSICIFLWMAACGQNTAPAAPVGTVSLSSTPGPSPTLAAFIPATLPPTSAPVPSETPVPPCTDSLTFLSDATIPDWIVVAPGSLVDKQWLVQNSGTCDWDSRYRLRLVSGPEMGAAEQALHPARAGAQAVLRIVFTAPLEPGTYSSTWQAVGPDGSSFGDIVTISIIVQ